MNPTPPASDRPLAGLDPRGLLATASARTGQPPFGAIAPLFPAYELLETLGSGGAGTVYRARHKRLDREVALKVLHPELGADADALERFRREARALARLQHPFLVGLLDFGEVEGVSFLVLEYCRGGTLRRLLTGDADARRDALRVLAQVCDAIDYAHAHGTVHRDLKPENVLLDERSYPRVADFGLVRLRVADTPTMTVTGDVMGTPHYMAPEQVAGQDADARADVYALGVMVYQALTGTLPVGRFDPPSTRSTALRRDLDEIVMRALDHDPAVRPTAGELGQQLARVELRAGAASGTPRREADAPRAFSNCVPRTRAVLAALTVLSLFQIWVDLGRVSATAFGLDLNLLGLRLPPIWIVGVLALADLCARTVARFRGKPGRYAGLTWATMVLGTLYPLGTFLLTEGGTHSGGSGPLGTWPSVAFDSDRSSPGLGPVLMLAATLGLAIVTWSERKQEAEGLLAAYRRRQRERKRRA